MNWQRHDYHLTDDRSAVDLDTVEALLRTSYWAADRSRSAIETSLANSTCFSLLHQGRQVGFERVESLSRRTKRNIKITDLVD